MNDPLLPGRIRPSDYLGQEAWWPSARTGGGWKCFRDASRQLRTFKPE
jgi:hypothetical protein